MTPATLAAIRQLSCNGVNHEINPVNDQPPRFTPRLEDFPYALSDNVRFADLDPNQHVKTRSMRPISETGRVTLMKDRSSG